MTRPEHDEYDSLAVGWALHALEPGEEAAFAEHLTGCDRCQRAVRESEAVLGELAHDVPTFDPPPHLIDRIHDAMGVTGAAPAESPHRPRPTVIHLGGWRRRQRWMMPAMAAGILLVALLGWNIALQQRVGEERQLAAKRQTVINELASSTRRAALRDTAGHHVGYVLQRGSQVAVVADGLRPNDAARTTYVLWALPSSGAAPLAVGRFDVATTGLDLQTVSGEPPPRDIAAFAVSREPGRTVPAKPSTVVASGVVRT